MTPSEGSTLIVGAHLAVTMIDPWDIVTDLGAAPFQAVALDIDFTKQVVVLELVPTLSYRSVEYKYLVARTRHEGVTLLSLATGDSVTCNLTAVASGHQQPDANVPAWRSGRGGFGFIGDVRLV